MSPAEIAANILKNSCMDDPCGAGPCACRAAIFDALRSARRAALLEAAAACKAVGTLLINEAEGIYSRREHGGKALDLMSQATGCSHAEKAIRSLLEDVPGSVIGETK